MSDVAASLRATRRDRGAYYTPLAVARHIARTAGELLGPERFADDFQVLDPSCGNGRLLTGFVRAFHGTWGPFDRVERPRMLAALHGVDADGTAVAHARRRLLRVARYVQRSGASIANREALRLEQQLVCADALRLDRSWESLFPAALARDNPGFDLILSNPPFLNIRRVTRLYGESTKRYYARHYASARGAYDQYVLFIERATHLLRAGGLLAVIVPNKWQVAEYAAASRRLLAENGQLLRVDDFSELRVFAAAHVYPLVLYWIKAQRPRPSIPVVRIRAWSELTRTEHCAASERANSLLSYSGGAADPSAARALRIATQSLGSMARIASGATGFEARRLADALEDVAVPGGTHFPFVVTGNIDRYHIRWGGARFMGRRWQYPALDRHHACLSAAKRQLYGQAKIVVAGLTRRLEAAWDATGCALGVQTFAVTPTAGEPFYLLGLLNSKLLTWYYRERNRGKELGGGFIAVHKRPLMELPIVPLEARRRTRTARLQQEIAALAARRTEAPAPAAVREIESALDRAVYQLYRLTADEMAHVERMAGELAARARRSRGVEV